MKDALKIWFKHLATGLEKASYVPSDIDHFKHLNNNDDSVLVRYACNVVLFDKDDTIIEIYCKLSKISNLCLLVTVKLVSIYIWMQND